MPPYSLLGFLLLQAVMVSNYTESKRLTVEDRCDDTYMIPGATALILIPFGACCCASARVNVAIAPFVLE